MFHSISKTPFVIEHCLFIQHCLLLKLFNGEPFCLFVYALDSQAKVEKGEKTKSHRNSRAI